MENDRNAGRSPYNCNCGKGFQSLEALRQHRQALDHTNARQRKRAARQRRLRREGKRP